MSLKVNMPQANRKACANLMHKGKVALVTLDYRTSRSPTKPTWVPTLTMADAILDPDRREITYSRALRDRHIQFLSTC